ncbi:MAG: DNA mismatch repair protein MutS [candidate division WOR-3 bacterium]|jgi:DNA mismatch repair protein MutS|nr:DNA mismatch repair protein MutS [candidate division WOR-3 bacterium]MDH7518873.1 DNA mismatch repair protein MutS [bacterium]
MAEKLTPLLTQYHRIKQRYPETLLLFRVGDFYEMFYQDAEIGARALNLTLTSRSHGPNHRVPLAGIPAKSLDTYVARLVEQGFKIAVCEQLEPPNQGKPVVARDVVEVITPGTLVRDTLLDEHRNNYLLAISPGAIWGVAFTDLSTGEFYAAEIPPASIGEELTRIAPSEILLPQGWMGELPSYLPGRVTKLDDYYFTPEFAFEKLTSHFGVANLAGFGVDHLTEAICAAGAILEYLEQTQCTTLPHLQRLTPYQNTDFLLIDRISRRNLELLEKLHPQNKGDREIGTLFWLLNRTCTPAGTRLLRRWLLTPLLSVEKINERLDAVAALLTPASPLEQLQQLLSKVGDLERVASRIALDRATPRDLVALRSWLTVVPDIKLLLKDLSALILQRSAELIPDFTPLVKELERALIDSPPTTITDGGIFRPSYNEELDNLRELTKDAKQFLARLQESERARTGIPNLRIGYNSVFGYYIEVTRSYLRLVPSDYIRKQTVTGGERFITPQLKEYETKIINAEERSKTLEYELFIDLRNRIKPDCNKIIELANTLATVDVLAAFARLAREKNYTRPVIDSSTTIEIKAGRHPVVETISTEPFIPNDTYLDTTNNQILIITGPNMAGKSTYLRQTALIVIMAQLGSFVPARSARIGIVDKIFTRIGASDDLARGVSTFLAEMNETANILNNATSRSLVILDEVGRGTATEDGVAIAWATVEYLHGDEKFCPRTLFATHYHELTQLPNHLPRTKNFSFLVREKGDEVIFLRKIHPGPADKSYGIAVAKLAGLPERVIRRARELLTLFTRNEQINFAQLKAAPEKPVAADQPFNHPVLERLRNLNIDEISPLKALNLLAELNRLLKDQ